MAAGTDEERVIDALRGEALVEIMGSGVEPEIVLGAAVEIDRELAGLELVDERGRVVRLPHREILAVDATHPLADRADGSAPVVDVGVQLRLPCDVRMRALVEQ